MKSGREMTIWGREKNRLGSLLRRYNQPFYIVRIELTIFCIKHSNIHLVYFSRKYYAFHHH